MTKLYVGIIRDHSSSMGVVSSTAMADYNTQIETIRKNAIDDGLDTIVSVIECGVKTDGVYNSRYGNRFDVTLSSAVALKPLTQYVTEGNTPLLDAIGMLVAHFNKLPDAQSPDTQFLVMVFTDGEEYGSKIETHDSISGVVNQLNKDYRWTFTARVPAGAVYLMRKIGFPADNICVWDGRSNRDLSRTTVVASSATTSYMKSAVLGQKATTKFYADMSNVSAQDVQKSMTDISNSVAVYTTTGVEEIKPFIDRMRGNYVKGTVYYQLVKTEPMVQDYKGIIIVDKATGAVYGGRDARALMGLPTVGNIRLAPGDHVKFEIYIQSTSINRKLASNTKVIVWDSLNIHTAPVVAPVVKAATPARKTATKKKVEKAAPVVGSVESSESYILGKSDGRRKQRNQTMDLVNPARELYRLGFAAGKALRPAPKKTVKAATNKLVDPRIVQVFADMLGVNDDKIKWHTSIVQDLGADSLDLVELTMSIEDDFNIEINDDVAMTWRKRS